MTSAKDALGKSLLYATDGTSTITEIDPESWKAVRTVDATLNGGTIRGLNELEIINTNSTTRRYLFCNQFQTNYLYLIDLKDGKCVKYWDLS